MVIRGGRIVDGTGRPGFDADLVINKGRVRYVGDASGIEDADTWDATGKVVCPGFIDIHNHSDFPIYADGLAQSGVRQGLTTVVTGNCGHGPAPAPDKELAKKITIGINDDWGLDFAWNTFEEYLDSLLYRGISINVAPLVAHGAVRLAAMGFDAREPTPKEMDHMKSLVAEAMSAGAVGLSTGLEYSPGRHAGEQELIALSKVAAQHGGIYASHIRERGDHFESAVEEALNIAREAGLPAQLSHLGPRPYAPAGSFDRVLDAIHGATVDGLRVGIDTFPDTWGPGHLLDLLPPWVYEGPEDEVIERLLDPRTADKSRGYVENRSNFLLRAGTFDENFLSNSNAHPELVGESLHAISERFGLDHTQTMLKLAAADGKEFANVMIRHIFTKQEDLEKLLLQPNCSVETDGAVASREGLLKDLVMNRSSFGYAPRFIREYALDRDMFTLEEAIRKMTSLPADSAQLYDRGRLEPGMAADVVVMDLEQLKDNSTDDAPQAYPSGIDLVAVNGEVVFENGAHTQMMPGQLLPT
jgi:N-acyl-D-amino-acid deacylase